MPSAPVLDPDELAAAISSLTGWSVEDGKLHSEFRFGDFAEAFAFMTRCALVAESMDHHPEWFNVYDRIRVDLTTHDSGGITALDTRLAETMNGFAGRS